MNIKKILEHNITTVVSVLAFVLVVILAIYYLVIPQKHVLTNVQAKLGDISENISAEGKVDSDKHVSLSFAKAGRVTDVNVKVGDTVYAGQVLASIEHGQLSASLQGANADVLSAQANVSAINKGATSQTVAVYNQNVNTTKLALSNAVNDVYFKIQDALINKLGTFFNNNTSVNPTLNIQTDSNQMTRNIEFARVDMTTRMADWNNKMKVDPTNNDLLNDISSDIIAAKSLMSSLNYVSGNLSVGGSGLSQSSINNYLAVANSASTEINTADTEFNTALQAYKTSNDQLNVIQASSTPEALQIAEANLAKAQANVASIQSQINDLVLRAPFAGIIASVNPKVGENFNANDPAIDVISPGNYKVDIFVPENQIAIVTVGSSAIVNFNDYANDLVATGTVTSVDLAQTIVNGIGAYKVSVSFDGSDQRIRTGMNAIVNIDGPTKTNVVTIPYSAVITKPDGKYVLVSDKTNSFIEMKVVTGITDGSMVEIVSGINVGDIVASFGEQNK